MPLLLADIDWNSLFRHPDLVGTIAVFTIIGAVVVISIIAIQWRKVEQTKAEAQLKEQLTDRGFTADEIVKVINAGVSGRRVGKVAGRAAEIPGVPCCR